MASPDCRDLSFLRNEQFLCDCVLLIGNRRIPVHKVLLAADSPYYRAMFTTAMIEANKKELNAPTDDLHAMDLLLDYVYSREIKLDFENVFRVLPVADMTLMDELKDKCCNFLKKCVNNTNALEIREFSEFYNCFDLARYTRRYILDNFTMIAKEDETFLTLSPASFIEYLNDDELNIRKEEDLVETVYKWVEDDLEHRREYLPQIFNLLRLGMIDSCNFETLVKENPLVASRGDCQEIVRGTMSFLSHLERYGNKDIDLQNPLVRPRIPNEVLLAVGGWSGGSPIALFDSYDTRADRWYSHPQLEESTPRAYHGLVTLDNKVYVLGGFDGFHYYNSVRRFDPVVKKWEEVAAMFHQRCYVSAAVMHSHIYACGGYDGRLRLRSVERYDAVRNQWSKVAEMTCRRSDAGAASLAGKLYVCGGFDGRQCLHTAEVYSPETDQWSLLTAMNSPRSGLSVVSYRNALYALGGFDGVSRLATVERLEANSSRHSSWEEVPEMEANSSRHSSWEAVPDMFTARSNFAAAVMDDMIFVIGGFNGTHTIPHVECFDYVANEWYDATDMSVNRSALKACVIRHLANVKDYTYHGHIGSGTEGNSGDVDRRRMF